MAGPKVEVGPVGIEEGGGVGKGRGPVEMEEGGGVGRGRGPVGMEEGGCVGKGRNCHIESPLHAVVVARR